MGTIFNKKLFLLSISPLYFSIIAMEEQPLPIKPNIPHYDRARRCFTRVPSLLECTLKQMPRVLVPNLEAITGDTLDSQASTIENVLKIPKELRKPIAFSFMLHAAQHGYKSIFYKKQKTKRGTLGWSLTNWGKELKICENNQEDTLACNDIILDYVVNPSGNTFALSLVNGAVQFFQKKDTVWKDIGLTLPNNNSTSFHITRFFNNTTCISYNKNTANVLTIHTLIGELLQSSSIPLKYPICTVDTNKERNILFFMDSANILLCCLKYPSSVRVQEIMTLPSDKEFESIVSDGNFFNYIMSAFSENPTFNVIGLIDNGIRSIKCIEARCMLPIDKKIYIKSFKKGILHLAKEIKNNNNSFDATIFEHYTIDINSETSVSTFCEGRVVKPNLKIPYTVTLALIALRNSKNPSQLKAWEHSSVVKNLPEEFKNQLMEEYKKKELRTNSSL